MARITRLAIAISVLLSLGGATVARAQGETTAPQQIAPSKPGVIVPTGEMVADEGVPVRPDLAYGMSLQGRWVSVPSFMLGLFTKKNVPLSSWGTGISVFRRNGNFDLVGSFNYQNMSPSDGNWLGKNHDAAIDTDLVQFRSLALYAIDISFIWHTMFNDWVGMHYGAGIGVGFVGGKILRTSDGLAPGATGAGACTDANAGDLSQCHPQPPPPQAVRCTTATCSENDLNGLGPGIDGPGTPHRFVETSVPPAIPVVNVVVGVDFKLPKVRGWEATIQGGFYDAFFLGGAVIYTF